MKANRIQEVLQKEIKKLSRIGGNIAPHFKPEDIHQFRVGVKKLRAIIHFVNSIKGEPKIKLTNKFKQLYRIAGTLRDAHLKYQTLTGKELALPLYYDNLTTIISRNRTEWEQLFSEKMMSKLFKKVTSYPFETLTDADLQLFLQQTIKKIKKINGDNPNDVHIHQMRKLIKDMVYIITFAQKRWPEAAEVFNKVPQEQLINISNLLGEYNDSSVLLRELNSFSSKQMQQDEENNAIHFVENTMKEHRSSKKELLQQIDEFVTQAETTL